MKTYLIIFGCLLAVYKIVIPLLNRILNALAQWEKERTYRKPIIKTRDASRPTYYISDGESYERYVAKCLVKFEGFDTAYVTKLSGDYGADVIATKKGVTYCVQCKNFRASVPPKAVQEVVASLRAYNAQKAMVVTNSRLTKEAQNLAAMNNVEVWEYYGEEDGM